MAIDINSTAIIPDTLLIQDGYGIPTHISLIGSLYVDLNTGTQYINKNGIAFWAVVIDSTFSGETGIDIFVTGGTYNKSTGTATFTNNSGGTFTVTGFTASNDFGLSFLLMGG